MAKRGRRKKQVKVEYGSLVGLIVFAVLIFFDVLRTGKMGAFLARFVTMLFGPWHIALLLTGFFVFFYLSFLSDKYPLNTVVFIGLGVLNVAVVLLGSYITNKGAPVLFSSIPGILKNDWSNLFVTGEKLSAGLFDSLLYGLLTAISSDVEMLTIIVVMFVIALLLIVPMTWYLSAAVWVKMRKDEIVEHNREIRAERERQREQLRQLREAEAAKAREEAEAQREQMMAQMNEEYELEEEENFDNEDLIHQMAAVPAPENVDTPVRTLESLNTQNAPLTSEIALDEDISDFSRTYFYIDQNAGVRSDSNEFVSMSENSNRETVELETFNAETVDLNETNDSKPLSENVEVIESNENKKSADSEGSKEEAQPKTVLFDPTKVTKRNGRYRMPPLSLLQSASSKASSVNKAAAEIKGKRLIEILANFGIQATLMETHIGPSVTKFEIKPDSSVKVSKIQNISDNIKMELSAKDVRIEAPVPGKNAVGIEIPNVENVMVRMSELMKNVPEKKKDSLLLFALGKDLMGQSVFCELNKMPHLLIAGATGSGKSVCINTIICSYLLRSDPDEVKLVLVDPKKVEFTPYHDIPHLLWPVVTDAKMANLLLGRTVGIMEERYDAFSNAGVRNIQSFNELVEKHNANLKESEIPMQKMPYIVVIIDELADLMMVAGKEVEMSIQRITQLARASGIHLIVATQRPSTDVITGIIKSNIPSRISFAVASSIDSRTILDQIGAERLLGNGDMLYYPQGENAPIRLQGAYVTDGEIVNITDHVKSQAAPSYDDAYFEFMRNNNMGSGGSSFAPNKKDDVDPMFDDVIDYIRETQKVSTSLLQRKFGFGYNRAARVVDSLEEKGLIGPSNGSKPREVYIKKDEE